MFCSQQCTSSVKIQLQRVFLLQYKIKTFNNVNYISTQVIKFIFGKLLCIV